jgi:arylsulfatase
MTGYYAQAVRRDTMPGVIGGIQGVRPRWARLLPEFLKPLGYRCYHSGKWHIDGNPIQNGFDHSYDVNGDGQNNYFKSGATEDGRPVPQRAGYYATTAVAEHAIKCLREHAKEYGDRPFFEYLAFTSPHFPLQAPAADIALYRDTYRAGWDVLRQQRYDRMRKIDLIHCGLSALEPAVWPDWNLAEEELRKQIGPGEVGQAIAWENLTDEQKKFQPIKMEIHAAMVHRMDTEIGSVIDQVKAMGVLENTVILFLSDNGASAEQIIRGDGHDPAAPSGSAGTFLCLGPGWSSAANTPLRLHKSWVHEGGISTPLIVQWPAGIKARGELRRNPGHITDLMPTILELAGGHRPQTFDGKPLPPLHGKSLVPAFTQDGAVTHDFFWWFHIGNRALRVGDWKIVASRNSPWELYDLSKDRSESVNLASAKPEKVRELDQLWMKHADEFRTLARQDPPPRSKTKVDENRKLTERQ